MKTSCSSLQGKLLFLQVCLLLTALPVFSAILTDNGFPANGQKSLQMPTLAERGNGAGQHPPGISKLWRSYKASCSRMAAGKSKLLHGNPLTIYGSFSMHQYAFASERSFFTCWLRPGYYIFLFRYTPF